ALGKDHSSTVSTLNQLAVLYTAKGDLAQAVKFRSLANAASERNLAFNLAVSSERQRLIYLDILSKQIDQTISLHLLSAPDDLVTRRLAATIILERKARALDATSEKLNALRKRFNPEDQVQLDRFTRTRSQLAQLALGGPQKMTIEQHRGQIKELENRVEQYEAEISRRSGEFRAQSLPVTPETVQAAIPSDAALIEFATYRPFNAKTTREGEAYGQPRYVAYVIGRQGEIEWRELGEAKPIDEAVAELRQALRNPKRYDVKRLAR